MAFRKNPVNIGLRCVKSPDYLENCLKMCCNLCIINRESFRFYGNGQRVVCGLLMAVDRKYFFIFHTSIVIAKFSFHSQQFSV